MEWKSVLSGNVCLIHVPIELKKKRRSVNWYLVSNLAVEIKCEQIISQQQMKHANKILVPFRVNWFYLGFAFKCLLFL
jgi:hypothetical protein